MLRTRTAISCLLTSLFLLFSTMPVWAASKASDEQTLSNASAVLTAMLETKDIPADVVAKADCIIVLPSVKKFAIGIGGTGGRGPLICRSGTNFTGEWSAPAMYSVGGASAGLQVGGTATDYVLLLMSQAAVDKVLAGKVKVGTDITAAAGPGASAPTKSSADVLTYSRTKGAFAGVSLSGATLDPDSDANKRLYGKDVSAKAIVLENAVEPTPAGKSLDALLNSKAPKHTM